MGKKKNPAAVELGRLGGLARARNLTKEQRSAIGKKGAKALWDRYRNMEGTLAEFLQQKYTVSLPDEMRDRVFALFSAEGLKGKKVMKK